MQPWRLHDGFSAPGADGMTVTAHAGRAVGLYRRPAVTFDDEADKLIIL